MREYVRLSLEFHLFFGRIMKEHAFFLITGFPASEKKLRQQAEWFYKEFEDALRCAVKLSSNRAAKAVLQSGEIVTEFTLRAEQQTERLAGVAIDTELTRTEQDFCPGSLPGPDRADIQEVRRLNRRILKLLNGLIEFKEQLLRKVRDCELYTANYPLLIEHILREAKLYRSIMMELERKGRIPAGHLREMESFWNQIMMEHALFIRGLLDPTECGLIDAADGFAKDYCRLLEEAKKQDMRTMDSSCRKAFMLTEKYQKFKTEGTKGILDCQVRSIILPLLADHVLREANHYLRILENAKKGRD